MPPNPTPPATSAAQGHDAMSRVLGGMSIFTMLMTIPQVLVIWVGHQTAGVSLLSWSAYLISAVLWFLHGLRTRDKNIYLACVV
jgi:uncharacterized protein with PQ loop repeat